MTAITTAAAGNWSSTGTWTGGVIPGSGDSVTLNHSVTVDSARTVGTSPANGGTPAIQWGTANVVLTINADLTLKGDLKPVYNNDGSDHDLIVQAAGTTVTFDSSGASSPSTTKYRAYLASGTGSSQYWHWRINGTSGSRCTVQSNAGGGNAWFDPAGVTGGTFIHAAWTNFIRIGDATNHAFDIDLTVGHAGEFDCDNCVFDSCGLSNLGYVVASSTLRLYRCTFKNGLDSSYDVQFSDSDPGCTFVVDGNYFSKRVFVVSANGVTWQNNTCALGIDDTGGGTGWTVYQDCIVDFFDNHAGAAYGAATRIYYIHSDTAESNPHGPTLHSSYASSFVDCVFESAYTGGIGQGDFVFTPDPGSALNYSLTGCILLPNGNNHSPGKLLSCLTVSGLGHITVNHNTVMADGASGGEIGVVQYGETGGGSAGEVVSLKSNLAWSATSVSAVILSRVAGTLQGEVTAANCTNNATWNAKTGTDGVGYVSQSAGSMFASGTPGSNDKTVASDPFFDRTRNLGTWAQSIGGSNSIASAKQLLRDRIDWTSGTYNPTNGATPNAAILWVRDGFRVTNSVLQNAGHDGATIGAMSFLSIASYSPDVGTKRNRPGRGPYSSGRYLRQRIDAFGQQPQSYAVSLTEGGAASDSISALIVAASALSESAASTDSISSALTAVGAQSETGSASDVVASVLFAVATVSEAGAVADSIAGAATAIGQVSDSASAADVVSALGNLVAALSEVASATDLVSQGGAIYSSTVIEAASAIDALSAAEQAVASLSESALGADQVTALAVLAGALSEAGSVLDVLSSVGSFAVGVAEIGNAADLVSILSGLTPGPSQRTAVVRAGGRLIAIVDGRRTVTVH